jgi:hypothetical protein
MENSHDFIDKGGAIEEEDVTALRRCLTLETNHISLRSKFSKFAIESSAHPRRSPNNCVVRSAGPCDMNFAGIIVI